MNLLALSWQRAVGKRRLFYSVFAGRMSQGLIDAMGHDGIRSSTMIVLYIVHADNAMVVYISVAFVLSFVCWSYVVLLSFVFQFCF